MATALEANAAAFLAVALLGVSAMLLGVSALSWRRLGNPRLLFTTLAFGALAAKGAWATWLAAGPARSADLVGLGLDFGVVLLLYASVAKR